MTISQINTMTLSQVNEELGAGGHYSLHNDVTEAREALVAMAQEYGILKAGK